MHRVIEAIVDESGRVFLMEPLGVAGKRRALLVVLDEPPLTVRDDGETYFPPAVPTPPLPRPPPPPPPLTRPAPQSPLTTAGPTRYRLERPLGEGGMGRTFVATDLHTGRAVCVKRLRPGVRTELIVQEWQSLARLESPHVVRCLDRYEQEGALHLVMEYVLGPTLGQRLADGLPLSEVPHLALGLLRGVSHFHAHDIIHCDLKPDNILLEQTTLCGEAEPDWSPKIIDFGLAVLDRRDDAGRITAEGRVAGTPAYMAPEQVKGWMLSPACDTYAVGLILWEAATGTRAFDGDTFTILQEKNVRTAPFRPEPHPGFPPALADLIERCTAPHPARRPTAAEGVRVVEEIVRQAR